MFNRRLMTICPESKKYIILNIILQWIQLLLNTMMIITICGLIQRAYEGTGQISDLTTALIIVVMTIIGRFFAAFYANRMSYLASKTVKKKLREMIYSKLLKMGPIYNEHVSQAKLVQETVEGVDQIESYFGRYIPQFFYAFIAPLTLFVIFTLGGSLTTALVLLVCVPLIPGAIMMVQKIAKRLLNKYWDRYTQLGSTFLENLQGMTTLKIYMADEYKNEQMNIESEEFRRITMKVLTMQLNSIIIMDFFAYGGTAIGIIMATTAFLKGQIPLANCLFMILLSSEFFLPMRRLGSYFHVAMNGMAAADQIFAFLDLEDPEEKEGTIPRYFKDIKFDDVSFSYEPNRQVLKHIDLSIQEHSFVGIVGESGCGKSTLVALLRGRYRPDKGIVRIGNQSIEEISNKELMNHMTYISHQNTFFKGTVKENLLMANPEADERTLWKALRDAELAHFFKALNGLDTELLENANNLSGGQRQRLAIARAILHETPIYIFDEATSNIDIESEAVILRCIENLARTNTVIMISHRLANVVKADQIYVMEAGEIKENGTHKELIKRDGLYARLYKTQYALENYNKEVIEDE